MHYDDIVCLVFVAAAAGRVVLHRRVLLACMIGGGSPPAWCSSAAAAVVVAVAATAAVIMLELPLGDLEGTNVHGVELDVVSSLEVDGPFREDIEPLSLRDTRALDVEFHDLRGSPEESIDRLVSRAVQLVHRVRVGIVPSGAGVDGLDLGLLVGEV